MLAVLFSLFMLLSSTTGLAVVADDEEPNLDSIDEVVETNVEEEPIQVEEITPQQEEVFTESDTIIVQDESPKIEEVTLTNQEDNDEVELNDSVIIDVDSVEEKEETVDVTEQVEKTTEDSHDVMKGVKLTSNNPSLRQGNSSTEIDQVPLISPNYQLEQLVQMHHHMYPHPLQVFLLRMLHGRTSKDTRQAILQSIPFNREILFWW